MLAKIFTWIFTWENIRELLVLCLLPSIFLIVGRFNLIWDDKNKKRCRHLLKGKVIDERTVSLGMDGRRMTFWKPRFSYTFNGKDYKAETPYCAPEKRFAAGDEVDIYIDEMHPEVFWIPGEAKELKEIYKDRGIIQTAIGGCGIMIIGFVYIMNCVIDCLLD